MKIKFPMYKILAVTLFLTCGLAQSQNGTVNCPYPVKVNAPGTVFDGNTCKPYDPYDPLFVSVRENNGVCLVEARCGDHVFDPATLSFEFGSKNPYTLLYDPSKNKLKFASPCQEGNNSCPPLDVKPIDPTELKCNVDLSTYIPVGGDNKERSNYNLCYLTYYPIDGVSSKKTFLNDCLSRVPNNSSVPGFWQKSRYQAGSIARPTQEEHCYPVGLMTQPDDSYYCGPGVAQNAPCPGLKNNSEHHCCPKAGMPMQQDRWFTLNAHCELHHSEGNWSCRPDGPSDQFPTLWCQPDPCP